MVDDELDIEEDIEDTEEEPVSARRELPPEPSLPEGKTVWIGAPDAPRQSEDGISDLFDTNELVAETEEDMDDLTSVDMEKDVLDADEDGSLESLVSVSQEDIIGTPSVSNRDRQRRRHRVIQPYRRYPPTTGMGGLSR